MPKPRAMLRRGFALLTAAAVAAGTCGCAGGAAKPGDRYKTVVAGPKRDAAKAKRANAKALQAMAQDDPARSPDWGEAEQRLKDALEADVTFGPAHNNLGIVYHRTGRLYPAAWEFRYAAKLMPDRPEPHNNLGLVLEDAGKLDAAVDAYDAAVSLAPDGPEYLGNAARARVRRGDDGPAVRELLEKVVLYDDRPDWLAWARERLALTRPAE